jgi:hypothetical protein
MASHYQAQMCRDMASVVDVMAERDDRSEWAAEAAAAEIRAALMLTRRAADVELEFALELKERVPRVAEALTTGSIDPRRARVIVDATLHLSPEAAEAVVERIIDVAGGFTTGQLRARLARLCIDVDPDEAKQRYDRAVARRRVVAEPNVDGTANLSGFELPPHRVAAATRRINRIARSLRGGAEPRTMDQLRADVYLDLIAGQNGVPSDRHHRTPNVKTASGKPVGVADRAVVDIVVPLETLTGLADHPGELSGYGPVIADIARQVAADQHDAEWRYTIVDDDTANPIAGGITTRRPSASQRRTVETLYRTCVFPGCRMPAVDCDLDHRVAWAEGGATHVRNLAPGCRHDHIVKHRIGWRYRRLPNGDHRWTSPLGHTYTTRNDTTRNQQPP